MLIILFNLFLLSNIFINFEGTFNNKEYIKLYDTEEIQ